MRTFAAGLCLSVFLVLAVFLGGTGAEDVKVHRVVRGDTLWDISKGYLKDPFLWPSVWRTNPEIGNPDLIFPGQEVRLPTAEELAATGGTSSTASPSDAATEPAVTVTDMQTRGMATPGDTGQRQDDGRWIEDIRARSRGPKYLPITQPVGIVTDDLPSAGRVLGSVIGKAFAGQSDAVIIDVPGASAGERYGVYRNTGAVHYPGSWKMRDKPLGNLVLEMGIIEIRQDQAGQIYGYVERSFQEIMAGDLVGAVPELPRITQEFTQPANGSVKGTVIAMRELSNLAGNKDIVYLDVGSNDGIAPGNRLSVFGGDETSMGSNLYLGEVVVLRVTPSTATALVHRSTQEIVAGQVVTAPM